VGVVITRRWSLRVEFVLGGIRVRGGPPEEFVLECAPSPGFDASQAPAGYSPRRPYCTGVYGAYAPGPPVTHTLSCLEQDIPGLDVSVEGVLIEGPSA
jgi:hypothetical protein